MRIYDASKQQFAVAMFVGVLNHFSLLSRFNAYKHMMTILYRFTHFPRPLQLHVFYSHQILLMVLMLSRTIWTICEYIYWGQISRKAKIRFSIPTLYNSFANYYRSINYTIRVQATYGVGSHSHPSPMYVKWQSTNFVFE